MEFIDREITSKSQFSHHNQKEMNEHLSVCLVTNAMMRNRLAPGSEVK